MSSEQPKSSSRKRTSSSGASTPSASASGSSTPRGGRRAEKANRPKPRARQKMKAAKLKQEEEDAILAANSFALRDEDDPMGGAKEDEKEEGEEGEEVEVMDLAGLEGGSSDLDEEMVEAAITSPPSRPATLPSAPPPPAPRPASSLKPTTNSHGLPSKPIAPLPTQRRRSPTYSPEPITQSAASNLFYVDIIPKAPKKTRQWIDPVAEAAAALSASEPQEEGEVEEVKDTLVLPSHIVVERPAPAGGDQEAVGEGVLTEAEVFAGELGAIEFLDGVDDRPASRYFDAQPEEGAAFGAGGKASMVCNICKQRGHVQRECTMQICLTCGAVDEHMTRSCPVALVCFACGGRGHRSRECTAPRSQQRHRGGGPMCDRCGSDVHPANNCPTLWRIYLYLSPPSREEVLTERQRLKELGGFEGDVLEADPESEWGDGDGGWGGWCYNCSSEGHWGDDCPEPRTTRSNLQDFSAFSSYNAHNSPFFSQSSADYPSATSSSISRPQSSRRRFQASSGGLATPMRDLVVPDQVANVGKRGKERERERARKYESKEADEDEGGSWFDKARGGGDNARRGGGKGKDRDRGRDEDRGRYERDDSGSSRRGGGGSGGGRRDNRGEDERKVDAFFSGGSGTDLEREFRETGGGGFSIKGRASSDSKDRGGSSSSSYSQQQQRAPGGSRSSNNSSSLPPRPSSSSSKPQGGGFSFKFNSPSTSSSSNNNNATTSPYDAPISAIRPSLLSRMDGGSPSSSSRGSPSNYERATPANYDRASAFERGSGGGGADGSSSSSSKPPRSKERRGDRRDGERKEKERRQEESDLRDRRSGGGGVSRDWMDSPDRREKSGGGGGGGGGGSSRYRGGYR